MTLHRSLLAAMVAALTISPALAQSGAPAPRKPAHHTTHKHVHHTKSHATTAPAKTAS